MVKLDATVKLYDSGALSVGSSQCLIFHMQQFIDIKQQWEECDDEEKLSSRTKSHSTWIVLCLRLSAVFHLVKKAACNETCNSWTPAFTVNGKSILKPKIQNCLQAVGRYIWRGASSPQFALMVFRNTVETSPLWSGPTHLTHISAPHIDLKILRTNWGIFTFNICRKSVVQGNHKKSCSYCQFVTAGLSRINRGERRGRELLLTRIKQLFTTKTFTVTSNKNFYYQKQISILNILV